MPHHRRLSTTEWVVLIGAALVAIAFLPGTSGFGGLNRVIGALYSIVPLALLALAGYAFYHWWRAEDAPLPTRPSTCPGCGGDVLPAWKACPNCARDLQRESVYCRTCGEAMLAGWNVCPSCGTRVSGSAPEAVSA
ncbi:MAG: hypothetical protein ACRDGF_06565 [Chloroflexota bacterium]